MNEMTFLTVRQTAAKYPAFSVGSLRWLLNNRARNGFSYCVLKIGARLLIDESQFIAWLRSKRDTKAVA